jgi:hypothetical protein
VCGFKMVKFLKVRLQHKRLSVGGPAKKRCWWKIRCIMHSICTYNHCLTPVFVDRSPRRW